MYKKVLAFLCLFMLSNVVFGAQSIPASPASDLSLAYLSMIFGTVGTSLQGVSGQMLGQLFYKFNQGVVIVAILVLVYNAIHTSLKTAMEGQLITPQRNFMLVCLRVALGFGFLLPFPGTGYNLLQETLMKVVIQSVNLANDTWGAALDYLKKGNTLFSPPEKTLTSGSGMLAPPYIKTLLFDSYKTMGKSIDQGALSFESRVVVDEICSLKNQVTASSVVYLQPQVTDSYVGFPSSSSNNTGCGKIAFYGLPGGLTSSQKSTLAYTVAGTLSPAAKYLFCQISPDRVGFNSKAKKRFTQMCSGFVDSAGASDPPPSVTNAASAMMNAFLAYSAGIQPARMKESGNSQADQRKFIPDAKSMGWVMAGAYYWNLISLKKEDSNTKAWDSYVNKQAVTVSASLDDAVYTSIVSNFKAAGDEAKKQLAAYTASMGKGAAGAGTPDSSGSFSTSMLSMIPIVGQVLAITGNFNAMKNIIDPTSSSSSPDPVVVFHLLGGKLIDAAGDLFFGSLISSLAAMVFLILCNGQVDLSKALSVVLSWLTPIITILTAAFIGAGFFLAYYVPIFPYIVFTFGVLAWLVAVIEAMVAMPLVALGVTHPEGHDLLGRAEQAVMLTLGVFLRPVLMIIGLVAGMILSLVGYRILLFSFGNLLQNLFFDFSSGAPSVAAGGSAFMGGINQYLSSAQASGGASFGAIMRGLFAFPVLLLVFCSLVYVVTEQCYSLISSLPDYILRWIGGPQSASAVNPMQMAGQVGGMAQSATSQLGGAMKDMAKAGADIGQKELKDYGDNFSKSEHISGELPADKKEDDAGGKGDDSKGGAGKEGDAGNSSTTGTGTGSSGSSGSSGSGSGSGGGGSSNNPGSSG